MNALATADDLAAAGPNDEKARQILDGARRIFLRDGFDGASMNDIVRAAGVSKGTLYVYFPSKEVLFAALIRHDKRQQAEQTCRWVEESTDIRTALTTIGRNLMSGLLVPERVALVRIVVAVAPKFPEIGRALYESGPKFGTDRLSALITRRADRGELVVGDARRAATDFVQLCQGDLKLRATFAIGEAITQEEIDRTVDHAVDVFLAAYAPRP